MKIFLLPFFLLTFCGCDVSEPLGNGFEYNSVDAHTNGIYKGSKIFVHGYIKDYKAYDKYIVGIKSVSRDSKEVWYFVASKSYEEYVDNLPTDIYENMLVEIKKGTLNWDAVRQSGAHIYTLSQPEIIFK